VPLARASGSPLGHASSPKSGERPVTSYEGYGALPRPPPPDQQADTARRSSWAPLSEPSLVFGARPCQLRVASYRRQRYRVGEWVARALHPKYASGSSPRAIASGAPRTSTAPRTRSHKRYHASPVLGSSAVFDGGSTGAVYQPGLVRLPHRPIAWYMRSSAA